jgi:hypothetical protein
MQRQLSRAPDSEEARIKKAMTLLGTPQ